MSKNIYDMLNNIETDISEYPQDTLRSDVSIYKLKKNFKNTIRPKKRYRKLAVAGLLITVLAGLSAGPLKWPVEAAARLVSYKISNALGINTNLSTYENIINQSITDNGITVTLNEVILDRDSLIVSTTEKWDHDTDNLSFIGRIFVNGKEVLLGASGSSVLIQEGIQGSVMEYTIGDMETSGVLDIELELTTVDEAYSGNWNFSFRADGGELKAATAEQQLDESFDLPDNTQLQLESITVNPVACKIYYTKTEGDISYDLKLTGKDNFGNPVEFYLSRSSSTQGRLNLDTTAGNLAADTTTVSTDHLGSPTALSKQGRSDLESTSGNLDEKAVTLTLTLYAVAFPEESGQLSDDWIQIGEAFTIDLP